jgi:cholesterol oxidase
MVLAEDPMSADTHFDAIIVGSGFGGSVMAYRLAEAGRRVCVLERGRPYPPGSFARTPAEMRHNFWDPSKSHYGLFDLWSFRGFNGLVSAGLGGGSLIYANVLLRKDERWFVDHDPWPVTRADLDPHYDRVERMMAVQRYPFDQEPYRSTVKTRAMQQAAAALGYEWMLPPLAVTFANAGARPVPGEPIVNGADNLHGRARETCRLCGECDIGCNYGSKNTLDFTYLSAAVRHGAEIRTLCEVRRLERDASGYRVRYIAHDPTRRRAALTSGDVKYTDLTATRVVLSAGTFGSPWLLLSSRDALPALSPALGTRFSGNGDLLTFAFECGTPMHPSIGPVITSAMRLPDALDGGGVTGRGAYIEDAGVPAFILWLIEAANAPGELARAGRVIWDRLRAWIARDSRTDISREMEVLLGNCVLSDHTLPLLGMGRDTPDGRMSLEDGWLEIDWTTASSAAYFERVRSTMRQMAEAWHGKLVDNPLWALRRVITVHPLGGCPMGRSSADGVVDAYGEVFNYPGLFVADGSVMPGPVGANPSLTIAALADRFAERAIGS